MAMRGGGGAPSSFCPVVSSEVMVVGATLIASNLGDTDTVGT
jgi:hypothetical protein